MKALLYMVYDMHICSQIIIKANGAEIKKSSGKVRTRMVIFRFFNFHKYWATHLQKDPYFLPLITSAS